VNDCFNSMLVVEILNVGWIKVWPSLEVMPSCAYWKVAPLFFCRPLIIFYTKVQFTWLTHVTCHRVERRNGLQYTWQKHGNILVKMASWSRSRVGGVILVCLATTTFTMNTVSWPTTYLNEGNSPSTQFLKNIQLTIKLSLKLQKQLFSTSQQQTRQHLA
jgi:hypothetical protein